MINSPTQLLEKIEKSIAALEYGKDPIELYEPISYIMSLGGKRLRPLLSLMSYGLFKDEPLEIMPQAISVELFHNFSLVHDDIMDKAPIRRGKPTVHEKWNENVGILSGDVMLVKVYDLLIENLDPTVAVDAIKEFNRASIKVCEGQQLDMNFENRDSVEVDEYLMMIRLKTAELLAHSLGLGALLAGKKEQMKGLMDFGINIGIGFQLKDDLLDAFGGEEFGKQVGGDIISRKKTYLTIKTMELADDSDRQKLDNYYRADSGISDNDRVKAVIALYEKYQIQEETEKLMNQYFESGFKCLKEVEAPLNRKAVIQKFAEALVDRKT